MSVAEKQSLTKAARELFISQPAMTAHMNALEKEFNASLLTRGGGHTGITPAGELVLNRFREILNIYDKLHDEIKEVEESQTQGLSLGFHGPADWMGISNLIANFAKAHSNVEITISIDTWSNLLKQVLNDQIELAFMEHSEIENLTDVSSVKVAEEPICVIIPNSHKLAQRAHIRVHDLENETLILPNQSLAPRFLHYLNDSFRRAGMRIMTVGQGNHYEANITLALAENGIAVMPASFAQDYADRFAIIPISDLDKHMQYDIIWKRENANTVISNFVTEACNDMRQDGNWHASMHG